MTSASALPVVLAALGGLVLALACLTVGRRALRQRVERVRADRAAPLRPVVMRLVAGDVAQVAAASQRLRTLDERTWHAVEPDLASLLLKVKGETHDAVVEVLANRGTLDRALRWTRSRDPVRRARGAEVLGAARRRAAVARLLDLLVDRDPEVRQVAARALGRVGARESAEPLLAAVAGHRAVPARIVSSALLRVGSAAHPALVRGLQDDEPVRRAVSADIAGLGGAVSAVAALRDRLEHDVVLEVQIRSARALGRIGAPSAVGALLAATADDRVEALRAVAARALGDLGSFEAVERLADLATEPSHLVAGNAAAALARCGPPGLGALGRVAALPEGAHAREALALDELRSGVPAGGRSFVGQAVASTSGTSA